MITNLSFKSLIFPEKTSTPIDKIQWDCRNSANPGIDEVDEWKDWSNRGSTPDQEKIEAVLDGLDLRGTSLLHVGIGNSKLAKRFAERVKILDGISIQHPEIRKAVNMRLQNYRVYFCNKYSDTLVDTLYRKYDYIIDNNPSSFACCRKHFYMMLNSYCLLLESGGEIITENTGLGWSTSNNDPHWGLTQKHWVRIGSYFNLLPMRYTKSVIALRKSMD